MKYTILLLSIWPDAGTTPVGPHPMSVLSMFSSSYYMKDVYLCHSIHEASLVMRIVFAGSSPGRKGREGVGFHKDCVIISIIKKTKGRQHQTAPTAKERFKLDFTDHLL